MTIPAINNHNSVNHNNGQVESSTSSEVNQTQNGSESHGALVTLNQQLQCSTDSDYHGYHGTELVMLYDYKSDIHDDLNVRRGDWIYADLNNQTVEGWLWAYCPKLRKYGFIPKAYARPPAMTSL